MPVRSRPLPAPLVPALLVLGLLASLLIVPAPAAQALPAGFVDEAVVDVRRPTAFAFSPAGLLVTTQPGELRVVEDGTSRVVLDLTARLCSNSERGLLGVAVPPDVDPDATTFSVYLFQTLRVGDDCYTDTNPDDVNAVSRFTFTGGAVDPASEEVLLTGIPSPGGNHNAGDLQFGQDGMLYVSVGDGGTDYAGDSGSGGANDAARDDHVLLGKVLRITPDGDVPADNPFADAPGAVSCAAGPAEEGAVCAETYAKGLRNPFRLAFDPNAATTRFRINDVGQNAWEEVDEGIAGADYGWNHCEATHDNPQRAGTPDCTASGPYTAPVHEYAHSSGCSSITGGAFVPTGPWPATYDGAYLYGDYVCGRIFALLAGGQQVTFAEEVGPAVHLGFGPDGALYYTTYAGDGQVRRIRSTGQANRPPVAALAAAPQTGPLPLEVRLDASGSDDPDGDALTYELDPGDGSAPVRTDEPVVLHTYTDEGSFAASVVAVDARGARSEPATVTVTAGGTAPVVTITSPPAGTRYAVGEELTLTGSATDTEDGRLPPAALEWTVTLHHDEHTHPLVGETAGETVTFRPPPPEDLAAVATSYLTVRLTATDADGVATTATRRLDPATAEVTLATDPPGLALTVNGTAVTGPATVPSWVGYVLDLDAPDQTVDGVAYTFRGWSDDGARQHSVTTPAGGLSLVATFRPAVDVAVERVAGPERVATAVALSQRRFDDCALRDGGAVVLARADAYPDALAGGPLAVARGGPVLLTDRDTLSGPTRAELARLCAGEAVLLGGEAALSGAVAEAVAASGAAVRRLAGGDRFATAAAVAAELPESGTAYLVEGLSPDPARGWPDAVSASWVAGTEGAPILLATRDGLPPATAGALRDRAPATVVLVGGEAALGPAVAGAVAEAVAPLAGTVERVAGADRYGTSAALAARAADDAETVFLATGLAFPDALAAGPSVVADGAGLLLVDGADLRASAASAAWLAERPGTVERLVLVGGEQAVADAVAVQAQAAVGG